MSSSLLPIYKWLVNRCLNAFENAYETSKRIQYIQRDYIASKRTALSKRSWASVTLYIHYALDQCSSQIYWSLIEYGLIRLVIILVIALFGKSDLEDGLLSDLAVLCQETQTPRTLFDGINLIWAIFPPFTSSGQLAHNEEKDTSSFPMREANQRAVDLIHRKSAWIQAALLDLSALRQRCVDSSVLAGNPITETDTGMYFPISTFRSKVVAYRSVALVPRSITRTLSRFQSELTGHSVSLVLSASRLAKHQALASLQYVLCLVLLPWTVSSLCQTLLLEPLVESWWNTSQLQLFINVSQEEQALRQLQQMQELLWLDIAIAEMPPTYPPDLSVQIHQGTIELIDVYNHESVNTVLHLASDLLSLTVMLCLLTWGKRRLAILNSWVQQLFYSLSDTMKAFFILLLADLCVGFHSPHGWEIVVGALLEHLGFSHNKHVAACFVSTFPVILDTVLKYWIFRHLNRISPSIVVTYHTMNE